MATSVDTRGTGLRTLCRGENYADSVLASLADQQEHQSLTDFILRVGDREIHAHKCILKISSEYFRAMFDSGMTELNTGEVNLDIFDFDAVKSVIDYMYGRAIQVDTDNLFPVLSVTEHFLLEELKERLTKIIVEHLKPDNCIFWLEVADRLTINELKKISREMIRIEFNEVAFSDDFVNLPSESVVVCIEHDIPLNADTVLKACLNWTMVDVDNRKKDFDTLAEHIDFSLCSPEYLKYVHRSYQYSRVLHENIASQLSSDVSRMTVSKDHVPVKESILMCSGHDMNTYKRNSFVYEINLSTNDTHQVAELPSWCTTSMPALCSTPQGIFGAGGQPLVDRAPKTGLASFWSYDEYPDVDLAPNTGSTSCWLYDKYRRQVESLPSLSVPVYGAGAVCLDNKVYVIGGHSNTSDAVDIFNMVTHEWLSGPKLLHQVHFPKVAAVGHNIYVFHNTSTDYHATDEILLQYLDTRTNIWHEKTPLPPEMTCASSMVAMGDNLYILASRCHKYSPISDSWTSLPDYSGLHHTASTSAIATEDKIALCGGPDPYLTLTYDCSRGWVLHRRPAVMEDLTKTFSALL